MHRVLIITSSTAATTTTAKKASRRLLTFPSSASRSSTTNNRVFKTNNYLRSRRPHTTLTTSNGATKITKQQPKQQKNKSTLAMNPNGASSSNSSNSSTSTSNYAQHAAQHAQPDTPQKLTRQQIKSIFLSAAIPMVGFGFMDNFVMITAGSAIDNSLGVQMGLATLTAAAMGQVVSDVSGVVFGDTLARVFKLSSAHLTSAQRKMAVVPRLRLAGAVVGVIVGCTLGATALYLIPDDRDSDNSKENASSSASSLSSQNKNQQQIVRIREQLNSLQKVLNDVMTSKEDKWCDRQARCTLYVNESMSNSIPKSKRQFFGTQQQRDNNNSHDRSIARRQNEWGLGSDTVCQGSTSCSLYKHNIRSCYGRR